MFGCFNITPAGLRILGQTCKQLQTLNIGQCYKVRKDCTDLNGIEDVLKWVLSMFPYSKVKMTSIKEKKQHTILYSVVLRLHAQL